MDPQINASRLVTVATLAGLLGRANFALVDEWLAANDDGSAPPGELAGRFLDEWEGE